MNPTNEQINRLCAEVCGWTFTPYSVRLSAGTPPHWKETGQLGKIPDYCTDRNALLQLYQQMDDPLYWHDFKEFFWHREEKGMLSGILMASARLHCIAALKALSKWPAEWKTEEE